MKSISSGRTRQLLRCGLSAPDIRADSRAPSFASMEERVFGFAALSKAQCFFPGNHAFPTRQLNAKA
jgi:hypothetical protein